MLQETDLNNVKEGEVQALGEQSEEEHCPALGHQAEAEQAGEGGDELGVVEEAVDAYRERKTDRRVNELTVSETNRHKAPHNSAFLAKVRNECGCKDRLVPV